MAKAKTSAEVPADNSLAEVISKIAPRKVMEENPKAFAPKKGERALELFTVFGIANGTKHGDTQYGEWEALTGVFEAVRISDGKRFQSGSVFLPGAIGAMLIGGLKAAQESNPDASVSFAIMVGIKHSDAPIGYEFTTKNIAKLEQADPLALLREKVLPALEHNPG